MKQTIVDLIHPIERSPQYFLDKYEYSPITRQLLSCAESDLTYLEQLDERERAICPEREKSKAIIRSVINSCEHALKI